MKEQDYGTDIIRYINGQPERLKVLEHIYKKRRATVLEVEKIVGMRGVDSAISSGIDEGIISPNETYSKQNNDSTVLEISKFYRNYIDDCGGLPTEELVSFSDDAGKKFVRFQLFLSIWR